MSVPFKLISEGKESSICTFLVLSSFNCSCHPVLHVGCNIEWTELYSWEQNKRAHLLFFFLFLNFSLSGLLFSPSSFCSSYKVIQNDGISIKYIKYILHRCHGYKLKQRDKCSHNYVPNKTSKKSSNLARS